MHSQTGHFGFSTICASIPLLRRSIPLPFRHRARGGLARAGGYCGYGLPKGVGQPLRALGGFAQRGFELARRQDQAFRPAVGVLRLFHRVESLMTS